MKDNFGNFLQTSQYWINKMFVLTEKNPAVEGLNFTIPK